MTATSELTVSRRNVESLRVVAGVDGSEAGYEAARQAARLVTAANGWLEVVHRRLPGRGQPRRWSAPRIADELEKEAAEAVRKGAELAGRGPSRGLVTGRR